MKKNNLLKIVGFSLILFSASSPAVSQNLFLPSVNENVEPSYPEPPMTDEYFYTHEEELRNFGFQDIPMDSVGPELTQIRDTIIKPYYKKNMKKNVNKEDLTITYGMAHLTNGPYNDLLVFTSRIGECQSDGCPLHIFRMNEQKKWVPAGKFQSILPMYRMNSNGEVEFASVGDEHTPTIVRKWNGKKFIEIGKFFSDGTSGKERYIPQ